MLKVFFKNVGQGDSIVLEWPDEEGINHIGIVDCKRFNSSNPVLNHLIYSEFKVIDFVFLSHAHSDHYSGLSELLDYCEKKGIVIQNFYHTAQKSQLSIWKRCLSMNELMDFSNLLSRIDTLIEKNLIINPAEIEVNVKEFKLNQIFNLGFLAPSYKDYQNLLKQEYLYSENKSSTVPDMNLVSTILKIYNDKFYILLTSDSTISSQLRAGTKDKTLNEGELILSQVPHHGSENNYIHSFWKMRKFKQNTPAVFSVGNNRAHKLPNFKVVNEISKLGYKIYSTNCVFGIKEYCNIPSTTTSTNLSMNLDFGTTLIEEQVTSPISDDYNGEKVFEIDVNGSVTLV